MDTVVLNPFLVKKQKLSEDQRQAIIILHHEKIAIIRCMRETSDIGTIRFLAAQVTNIEYSLQKEWGFALDSNYHRWHELPHCSCPKKDNEERWGQGGRIYNADCIIHGSNCTQLDTIDEEFII